MFSLHDFLMKTLMGMAGQYPEFQVREFALNWYARGVLAEGDLMAVEGWFTPAAEPEAEEGSDADDE